MTFINHVFIISTQRNSSVHYYPGSTNILSKKERKERGGQGQREGRRGGSEGAEARGGEGKETQNCNFCLPDPGFHLDSYVRKSSVFAQVLLS